MPSLAAESGMHVEPEFMLPEFYMPFHMRVNPHVAAARDHAREWAQTTGMVAQGTAAVETPVHSGACWDLERYDAVDFPQFAAMIYPDADAAELALLAGWCILLWYVDDRFKVSYLQDPAPERIHREIDRFMAFFPAYPSFPPAPRNPAERAVADLWTRTAARTSPAWRRRCAAAFRGFLEASHIEVRTAPDRLADPIDFIPLRRDASATRVIMHLLEHALDTEMPSQVRDLRSFQALNDAANDCVGLQNDIYSYTREAANGEADSNGVRVFQRALGGSLQQAADTVSRFLTARMHTFKAIADVDLPEELSALTPEVRDEVLGYADALRSALAGMYAWPFHTTRYGFSSRTATVAQRPSGLGTSAARIALQLK
jgi:germacradienol/geosmin synthase